MCRVTGRRRDSHVCVLSALLLLAFLALAAEAKHRGSKARADGRCNGGQGRNPIFVVPGIMGSDLDVRFTANRGRTPCSLRRSAKMSLWPPFSPDLLRNLACFKYLLQPVPCGPEAGDGAPQQQGHLGGALHHRLRLCNSPGVTMAVNPGGEAGTGAFAFQQGGYTALTDFLINNFGYELGKDLFAAPYDWRLTLSALEEAGHFDAIARRVEDAVARNCGRKALLIGHSMGTLVSLGLLRHPRFERWRAQNVMGYVALAPPFGGSTFAVASKLGGSRIDLMDFIGDLLQPVLNELVYAGSRGLPSMLMLMPKTDLWGKDFVLVSTPQHNYTIGELKQLFDAIGDTQSAQLFDEAHSLGGLVSKGPVPGVATHCIYGSQVPTVQSWRYRSIVKDRPAPPGSANAVITGRGDGIVNVESMRLCNRLTNESHIHELGPGVDHGTVLSHPESLAALKAVVKELLASQASGDEAEEEEGDEDEEQAGDSGGEGGR